MNINEREPSLASLRAERDPVVLNPQEAAIVATTLSAEALEQWVAELPAAVVAPTLLSIEDAKRLLNAAQKGLEARLVLAGQAGQHFMIGGREYAFIGSQQKGYRDFPGLMRFLVQDCGLPPLAIADAVTEAKVTTLREAIAGIADDELREAALAEVEAHRVPVGARGAPHLVPVDKLAR